MIENLNKNLCITIYFKFFNEYNPQWSWSNAFSIMKHELEN